MLPGREGSCSVVPGARLSVPGEGPCGLGTGKRGWGRRELCSEPQQQQRAGGQSC